MTTRPVQIKILVMGDKGVGKTVALDYYRTKIFESKCNPTHKPRMVSTQVSIANEIVALDFWELSTNMTIQSNRIWEQVDGVILAFDLTDLDTFKSMEKCLQRLYGEERSHLANNIPFMVCCLKSDLHPHEVDTADIKQWCKMRGKMFEWHRCSSKNGLGVEDAFHSVILKAKELKQKKLLPPTGQPSSLDLNDLARRLELVEKTMTAGFKRIEERMEERMDMLENRVLKIEKALRKRSKIKIRSDVSAEIDDGDDFDDGAVGGDGDVGAEADICTSS